MKKTLNMLIVLCWALLSISCDKSTDTGIMVESITFPVDTLNVVIGVKQPIEYTILPENAANKQIQWSVNLPEIISIDADGQIEGLKEGKAVAIAKSLDGSNVVAALPVSVMKEYVPVESVSLDKSVLELGTNSKGELIATVLPQNATNSRVKWSSSDERIAQVSCGIVYTGPYDGEAMITVTTEDGSKQAQAKVIVTKTEVSVEDVYLSPSELTLTVGETYEYIPEFSPKEPTNTKVSWSSSSPEIVSVENGVVKALSVGQATVTVKTDDGGHTDDAVITVVGDKPSSSYVDEYGIDHGAGTVVDGVEWAPVNCGYHVEQHPYGKLYQWGRKYGQGSGEDVTLVESASDGSQLTDPDDDTFYTTANQDWTKPQDWFTSDPAKQLTEWGLEGNDKIADPCPEGWRVPTKAEMSNLIRNVNYVCETIDDVTGLWFSGSVAIDAADAKVFLPCGETRWANGSVSGFGYSAAYWTSSLNDGEDPAKACAFSMFLDQGEYLFGEVGSFDPRVNGYSIRCVKK